MIHHEINGEHGDWLVFVHGLTASSSDWREQIPALSDRYRCLTLDLRGHGRSAGMAGPYDMETLAADVVALMHKLSIERAVLIGHSMGTRVVAAAAIQAPELVGGLVFVDGSRQGHNDPIAAREGVLEMLGTGAQAEQFIDNMFSMMFTDSTTAVDRAAVMQRVRDMPFASFQALISNMAAWDAGRMLLVLHQLSIPVSVVQSTQVTPERVRRTLKDGETTPYLDLLRASLAEVSIEIVAGVGHFTQFEAAETVTAAIDALAQAIDQQPRLG